MALELTVGKGGYRDEDKWYNGTIDSIEETEHTQYGPGLKWNILLDDDTEAKFPETWAFSSQDISPKSKVYSWLVGIYGRAPDIGASVDLGKLFGVRVAVQFAAHRTNPEKQVVAKFKGLDEERQVPTSAPVTNKDTPF